MIYESNNEEEIKLIVEGLGIGGPIYNHESYLDLLDQIMVGISKLPAAHCPLTEIVTPGLYSRICELPGGFVNPDGTVNAYLLVSGIHLQHHQYVIPKGAGRVLEVMPDGCRWFEFDTNIHGPIHGITKPNTRRLILITRDTIWQTFHPNKDNLPIDELLEMILGKRTNPYLSDQFIKDRLESAKQKHLQLTEK